MYAGFVETLAAVVVVLGTRLLVVGLPLRRAARTSGEAELLAFRIAGLAHYWAAMFFHSRVAAVPGTPGAVDTINTVGTGSVVWYAEYGPRWSSSVCGGRTRALRPPPGWHLSRWA